MMVEKQGLSTSRDAVRDPESARAFKDMGFVFVRYFLVLILASTSLAAGVAGFLVWHFGMDVSVEGTGVLEPRGRHLVKSEVNGIIQQIETGQGRRVTAGEQLVVLDSEEWRTDLRKVEKDLEVNRSRGAEIEVRMGRERDILQAEVARARLGVKGAALYLERVRLEQQIYSGDVLLPDGHSRKPLEELVPVRQGVVELQQRQAELRLRQQRLRGVEAGWQEIRTLEKVREKLLQDRDLLQHRLERTIICAPVGGTVLTRDLEKRIGDRIQAGEAILELAEMSGWQARVTVGERDVPKVKTGQRVRLYIHAFPHLEYKIFSGRVEEVSVEPAGDGTGYPVKVSIADPEVTDGARVYSLAYGMSADVRIVVEQGRIAELLWRRLLRSLGEVSRRDIFTGAAGG